MNEKLNIAYPIIVEGKYDRLRLLSICNATVLTTDGFGIFKKNERLELFRQLSRKTPVILLTDSDGAGKLIRSHLTSAIPKDRLIHLYVPRIEGVEKRKKAPSAEGVLGVEGMERTLLRDLFIPYVNEDYAQRLTENPLCKADLYEDGLTGGTDSAAKRDALALQLGLPPRMTPNAWLAAVRMLCTYEEYLALVGRGKI